MVGFENRFDGTTYSYDLETKKWEKKQTLKNYEVTGASTAVIDNKLYLLGGTHYIPQIVYVYDPEKDTWVKNGTGFTAGYYSALAYKGKILMTGGVNRIKVYDPKSQSATAVTNPKALYRMAHSSAVLMIPFTSSVEGRRHQVLLMDMQMLKLNQLYLFR